LVRRLIPPFSRSARFVGCRLARCSLGKNICRHVVFGRAMVLTGQEGGGLRHPGLDLLGRIGSATARHRMLAAPASGGNRPFGSTAGRLTRRNDGGAGRDDAPPAFSAGLALPIPDMPLALTRSSTGRVETPGTARPEPGRPDHRGQPSPASRTGGIRGHSRPSAAVLENPGSRGPSAASGCAARLSRPVRAFFQVDGRNALIPDPGAVAVRGACGALLAIARRSRCQASGRRPPDPSTARRQSGKRMGRSSRAKAPHPEPSRRVAAGHHVRGHRRKLRPRPRRSCEPVA
jgi:hypothetical protein